MSSMLSTLKINDQYEFLFKGHHVTHFPNKIQNSISIAVRETTALSHVTHDYAAENITQGDYYVFKPQQKKGKGNESERLTYVIANPADSLAPNAYTQCYQVNGPLFPGSYIWWSPSHEVSDKSYYGNNKFMIKLSDMIECYKKSLSKPDVKPFVHFRCGGTLRFDKQACKVIIVCPTECPELDKDKESFPVMEEKEYDFEEIFREDEPKIKLRYDNLPATYKLSRRGNLKTVSQYVAYAFAFYFPNDSYELKIPKDKMTLSKIMHGFCVGKEKDLLSGEYLCPNLITIRRPIKSQQEMPRVVHSQKLEVEEIPSIEEPQDMKIPQVTTTLDIIKETESVTSEENTELDIEEQETTRQSVKRKRSPNDDDNNNDDDSNDESDDELSSPKQKVPAIEKEEEQIIEEQQQDTAEENEEMEENEENQDTELSTAEI